MSRLVPRALIAGCLLTTVPLVGACKGGGAKAQVAAEYKVALPALLDMVGESPVGYMVVRDMSPFMDVSRQVKTLVDGPVDQVLKIVEDSGEKVDRKEFEEFRTKYGQLLAALEASGIKWDQGMVVNGKKGGEGVFLFKGESLDKLGPILTALDEDPSKVTKHCANLEADPSWIACGKSADEAKAFKPAKKGSELVATLEHDLPGVDFKRINLAFDFEEASMVLSTDPGIYHLAVHAKKDLPPEFAKVSGRGPAKSLRLVSPGDTFLWGRIDMGAAKQQAGGVPAPAKAMVEAFDGEFMFAGISDPMAFIGQVGVTDPYPVRSILDLGWTQKDNVPKEIPDLPGVSFKFEAEEVSAAGETFRVLSAIFESPELAKWESMWKPVVSAWVGTGYLTLALGAGSEEAKRIASASGDGPSDALLASLPPGLAAEFKSQEVSYAYHVSLDGLQSPALMGELEKHWADVDLPDKPSFDAFEGVMQLFAPISEFTMWVSRTNTSPVFHLSVRTFGDSVTDEGKAALAAMDSITKGTSRADAYGGLHKKFGGSHRAHAYEVRASSDMKTASLGGMGLLGVGAAVAIPAFAKYQRQSRQAVEMMEERSAEVEAEMEAEMRKLEAQQDAVGLGGMPVQAVPSDAPAATGM